MRHGQQLVMDFHFVVKHSWFEDIVETEVQASADAASVWPRSLEAFGACQSESEC